jgi:hypothetical protein
MGKGAVMREWFVQVSYSDNEAPGLVLYRSKDKGEAKRRLRMVIDNAKAYGLTADNYMLCQRGVSEGTS